MKRLSLGLLLLAIISIGWDGSGWLQNQTVDNLQVTGNQGIGTTSPRGRLDVNGTIYGSFSGDGSGLSGINGGNGNPGGASTNVQLNDGGQFYGDTGFVYNKTTHNVGIGTTAPVSKLQVNGSIYAENIVSKGPMIDITIYGAIGDDSTDCTSAFSQALALSQSTGRTVYVPAGVYKITQGYDLKGAKIKGDGWGTNSNSKKSVLKFYGLQTSAAFTTLNITNLSRFAAIEDIEILANSWDASTGSRGYGLDINSPVIMKNVYVNGFYLSNVFLHNDVSGNGPYESLLENVYSVYSGNHGILIGTGANVITLVNCQAKWNGAPAYSTSPTVAGNYDGIHVERDNDGNPGSAYYSYTPQSLSVIGGDASYNSRYGWYFKQMHGSTLSPGYAEGNLQSAPGQAYVGIGVDYSLIMFGTIAGDEAGINCSGTYDDSKPSTYVYVGGKSLGSCDAQTHQRNYSLLNQWSFLSSNSAGTSLVTLNPDLSTGNALLSTFGGSVLSIGSGTAGTNVSFNGGSVGIGSSVPQAKLDVEGNVYVNGNIGIGSSAPFASLDINSANVPRALRITNTALNNYFFTVNGEGTRQIAFEGGASGGRWSYTFRNQGHPGLLDMLVDGNVGIGVTNPLQRLEVNGSIYVRNNIGIGSSAPQALLDVEGSVYVSGSGGSTNFLTNVGIGSSSPRGALDVNGYIYGNGSQLTGLTTGSSQWSGTSGNPITYAYNVGIGTTAPRGQLEVDGQVYIRKGTFAVGEDYTGNGIFTIGTPVALYGGGYARNKAVMYGDNSAYWIVKDTTSGSEAHLGISDHGGVYVGAASPEPFAIASQLPYLIVHNSGNVGIYSNQHAADLYGSGTRTMDSPAQKLQVEGSVYVTANIGIGTSAPTQILDVVGTVNATGFRANGSYAGGTDTTHYWVCTAADCSTKCQLQVHQGLMTGCI